MWNLLSQRVLHHFCMFVKLNRWAAIEEMEQCRAVGYTIINLIRKQQTNIDKSLEPNTGIERIRVIFTQSNYLTKKRHPPSQKKKKINL